LLTRVVSKASSSFWKSKPVATNRKK
jgi:hypothetical protein